MWDLGRAKVGQVIKNASARRCCPAVPTLTTAQVEKCALKALPKLSTCAFYGGLKTVLLRIGRRQKIANFPEKESQFS